MIEIHLHIAHWVNDMKQLGVTRLVIFQEHNNNNYSEKGIPPSRLLSFSLSL